MLQWEDLTVAYFSKHNGWYSVPACGTALHAVGRIFLSSCSNKVYAVPKYMCEKEDFGETGSRATDGQRPVLQIPSSSYWTPPISHVVCPSGHFTNKFLACDKQSACLGKDDSFASGDKEMAMPLSCVGSVTSTPPSFSCSSGSELVPYSMVCDHSPDCPDSSDEDFCVFPSCSSVQFQCRNKQVGKVYLSCYFSSLPLKDLQVTDIHCLFPLQTLSTIKPVTHSV